MYNIDGVSEAWAALRATRWQPPGAATTSKHRAQTYVFALEQSEQMFRAAATVGQPTRPVLAYYGLNQAGRAIAAASNVKGDDWRLLGHGLSDRDLQGPLPDIGIHCEKAGSKGSFVRLSEILDSPLWSGAARLRQFWDAIPEARLKPLVDDESRRMPLYVDHTSLYSEPHPIAAVPVCYFPPWVVSAEHGAEALASYLAGFPAAQGYDSYVRTGWPAGAAVNPDFTRHDDGWGELQMNWYAADDKSARTVEERKAFMESITRAYGRSRYFFPAIAASGRAIHPLMAWWAVLHCLSMLARYQPAEWSGHIDVNVSRYAVALELLLNDALTVVPVLIADAIDQAAAS